MTFLLTTLKPEPQCFFVGSSAGFSYTVSVGPTPVSRTVTGSLAVIAKCGGLKHGPDPVNSMMMRRDFRSGRHLEQLGIDTRLGGIAENGDHLDSGLPDPAAPPVGWRADSSVGVFA